MAIFFITDLKIIEMYNYNYNVIMQGINFNQRPTS